MDINYSKSFKLEKYIIVVFPDYFCLSLDFIPEGNSDIKGMFIRIIN